MNDDTTKVHPLIGRGCLSFTEGKCHYQGRVVDVFEQTAMMQLYGWIGGDPTNIIGVPIADLLTPINWKTDTGWITFEDDNARNDFYETRVTPANRD